MSKYVENGYRLLQYIFSLVSTDTRYVGLKYFTLMKLLSYLVVVVGSVVVIEVSVVHHQYNDELSDI